MPQMKKSLYAGYKGRLVSSDRYSGFGGRAGANNRGSGKHDINISEPGETRRL